MLTPLWLPKQERAERKEDRDGVARERGQGHGFCTATTSGGHCRHILHRPHSSHLATL